MSNTRRRHPSSQQFHAAASARVTLALTTPSKRDLYADLAQAVANTAAMNPPEGKDPLPGHSALDQRGTQ